MLNENIMGELIKYYRTCRGLSQNALAEGICSREYIGKIERGEHVPTLDLISQLSQRLNINLYSAYSTAYTCCNLETYLMVLQFNKAFVNQKSSEIEALIQRAEDNDAFLQGEPKQVLCYAKSLIYFENADYKNALSILQTGLASAISADGNFHITTAHMSNVEFALGLSLGVNLCKDMHPEAGVAFLNELKEHAFYLLEHSLYDIENNRSFWLNIVCSCQYNTYSSLNTIDRQVLSSIDNIISYQTNNNRSHMLTELLLCKAAVLMNLQQKEEALASYASAQAIGRIYHSEKRLQAMSRTIINRHSDLSLFS